MPKLLTLSDVTVLDLYEHALSTFPTPCGGTLWGSRDPGEWRAVRAVREGYPEPGGLERLGGYRSGTERPATPAGVEVLLVVTILDGRPGGTAAYVARDGAWVAIPVHVR